MDYNEKREKLLLESIPAVRDELSPVEAKADQKLKKLREELLKYYKGKDLFKVDMLSNEELINSPLHEMIHKMPKACDLHVHGLCLMPVKEFVDFLIGNEDIFIAVDGTDRGKLYTGGVKEEYRSKGFMTVRECIEGPISRETLENMWTLKGNPEGVLPWDYFEVLFAEHGDLADSLEVFEDYYYHAFKYYVSEGIYHVEPRALLFGSHDIAEKKSRAIMNAYHRVRRETKGFTCTMVGTVLKHINLSLDVTKMLLDNAIYSYKTVIDEFDPDDPRPFVGAIDFVNEEDHSRDLKEIADIIQKATEENPGLTLLLHAGESNIPTNSNVIDAVLLGAKRIGHAFNLYRYPGLYNEIREKNICIEVCPISNRILDYTADLRLHPAIGYINAGLPVAIGSDDPGYQEHSTLTDDFFAIVLCWNFGIAEIKKLILTAVEHAVLTDAGKKELKEVWEERFRDFCNLV
ncbi:MAG: hypothetical protein K6F93_08320 [Lachnospiraceae bacterium]|nr:hypothetical protein [Lachnospiraceae bacterium]